MPGIWETVLLTVVTTLVTLATTGLVTYLAKVVSARRIVFRLHRGAAATWRLKNTSGRKMLALDCRISPIEGDWRAATSGDHQLQSRDLRRGEEMYFTKLDYGETLLIAWLTSRRPRARIHTAEVTLREGVDQYEIREGTLTYGWCYPGL